MHEQTPAPDWYPDPVTPGQQRFWDGSGWTNNTAPGIPRPIAPDEYTGIDQGVGWQPPPPQPVAWQSNSPAGGAWSQGSFDGISPYYGRAYAQFESGGSRVVWNWAAFLFGALWYLYRGMWVKAVLLVALVLFSGGFLSLPVWIYGGLMGTHDDYLLRRRGTQGW